MALPPLTYAELLGQKIAQHKVKVWLVNTGWTGGGYGEGQRIQLSHTRAMVKAILTGALQDASWSPDPIFGISIPDNCPDVPSEILQPRQTWKDKAAYDLKARELAAMFKKNFDENLPDAPAKFEAAGPQIA